MTYRATFRPKVEATLKPHWLGLIGYQSGWVKSGLMDRGPYTDQQFYHMSRSDLRYEETQGEWVPEEDLEFIPHSEDSA